MLRWGENPMDRVAGFRVLQLLPGIGPTGTSRILDRLAGLAHVNDLSVIEPPKATADDWPGFAALFKTIRKPKQPWPEEMHLTRAWYEPHLARLYDDAALRMADLAQLEEIAGTSVPGKVSDRSTLDPPDATSGRARAPILDDEYTILSTIHSAKGQVENVRVLNVIDGCIPSDMATGTPEEIEEERRLLHVAMTELRTNWI